VKCCQGYNSWKGYGQIIVKQYFCRRMFAFSDVNNHFLLLYRFCIAFRKIAFYVLNLFLRCDCSCALGFLFFETQASVTIVLQEHIIKKVGTW